MEWNHSNHESRVRYSQTFYDCNIRQCSFDQSTDEELNDVFLKMCVLFSFLRNWKLKERKEMFKYNLGRHDSLIIILKKVRSA